MSEDHKAELPGAPRAPYRADGTPLWGTYRGAVGSTAFGPYLAAHGEGGAASKLLREKRWQWWGVMDERVAAGSAIVRLGYVAQGFFWCLDRERGEMLCDHEVLTTPWKVEVSDSPLDGRVAELKQGRGSWQVKRGGAGGARIEGAVKKARWALDFEGEGVAPMTAICPVASGQINVTVKQAGMRARGELEVEGRRFEFGEGAWGMLDYTHGMLARETAWRWGIGSGISVSGARVAFNVVEGFNEGLENVAWIEGEPRALGEVRFSFDASSPRNPWRVEGEGVSLELTVEGVRAASTDLVAVSSRYVQPVGVWRGELLGERVEAMVGVAEDHEAKW